MAEKGIRVHVYGDYKDKDIARAMRDLKTLQRDSMTTSQKFEAFGSKVQGIGKDISRVGGTLTKSVTLPIVGLGAAAVKGFADFDSALTESTAIMGDVSEEVRDRMAKAAREVATSLNISHKDAAESFYFLASAGLDAEQSIAALPQVAAFAKAGMFDMATATDLATDAQSALGMVSEDSEKNLENLTRVTDVFVKANTLANASVEQFSEAITAKAGVALRNAGKDIEEGTAVLAVFADQGVKGSQAGTTLTRTLEGLQDNARKNADAFDELNIGVYDSEGAMRPMVDIVRDMENAFEGMTTEERNAAIAKLGFNKLAKQGILALVGNSDALEDYESGLRDAGGTVDEVAGKQLETFNEKLGLLGKQFADIAIEFGPLIIDQFLRPLGEFLQRLAQRISELSPQQREMIVRFAGIAAIVGPVLLIVGKLVAMFGTAIIAIVKVVLFVGKIIAIIKVAITVIGAVIGVLKILAVVMFAALGPIGLIIAAVAALIAIFVALYHNNETVRRFIDETWQAIQRIFHAVVGSIIEIVQGAWNTIYDATQFVMEFIRNTIETVWDVITTLFRLTPVGLLIAHWETLREVTAAAFQFIVGVIETFRDGAVKGFNFVKTTVTTVFNGIYTTITTILRRVKNAVKTVINFIIDGWNRISFSVPSVDVPFFGKVGGFDIGVPQIPRLAAGGLVTGPTLALIGEAGPELVLPLTGRNAERAGVGTGTINITVNAGLGTDGAEVGRAIVDAIASYERRNGKVYATA